jgi:WD40 repeat protein
VALAVVALLALAGGSLHAQETEMPGGVEKTAKPRLAAPIRIVAFSPDGKSLAVGGGVKEGPGQIILWDIATRKLVWQESLPRGTYSLAFAPDGKILAVTCLQPDVRLLDAATGKTRLTWIGPAKGVWPVAFSSDGKTLAGGGLDGTIKLWDVSSGKERLTMVGHQGQVLSIALSPDGKLLLSGGDDYIARLWNLETGKEVRTMPRFGSIVRGVGFSRDGRWFAVGAWDGLLRIYDCVSGTVRTKIQYGSVDCLDFAPDNRTLVVCGVDSGQVRIYRLDLQDPNPQESRRIQELLAALDNDSYLVREKASGQLKGLGLIAVPELEKATKAASVEVRVRARSILAEVRSPSPWALLKGGTGEIRTAVFSPDGKMIASGSREGEVKLWDVASQKAVATLEPANQ